MSIDMLSARENLKGLRDLFRKKLSGRWDLPDVSLLPGQSTVEIDKEINYEPPVDPKDLIYILNRYGIQAVFKDYRIGAAVTTYEVEVPVGTRFNKINRLRDDIARDLGAPSLRVIQCLGDAALVGFEFESPERYTVYFKEHFQGIPDGLDLPIVMGEDTNGHPVYEDLTHMPHMLIAGQTGSGKSVFMNTLITTLLCKKMPDDLKFLMVDPKQIEFVMYEDLPHLMRSIASDPEEARVLLDLAVNEMEHRFQILRHARVKKISDYNKKHPESSLPYIVFIVDEFADLMLMGTKAQAKEVESNIVRIAQKARAVGIHMVLATQKPLASIVTSLIKANMPARVSFAVASGIDSRVILDDSGAEALTGMGDMLYKDPNARSEHTKLRRIQAPWISDDDLEQLFS